MKWFSRLTSDSKKYTSTQKDIKFAKKEITKRTLKMLPYYGLTSDERAYVKLKNTDYGYMQIMELPSKDSHSLGNAEVEMAIGNFYTWLSSFTAEFTIESTKLPTDTSDQIAHQRRCLRRVEKQLREPVSERVYQQLLDRRNLLLEQIQVEEIVRSEIYNSEFLLFLFGKTIKELDETVRRARLYGNGDFVPEFINREKKIQILRQYNNFLEKL